MKLRLLVAFVTVVTTSVSFGQTFKDLNSMTATFQPNFGWTVTLAEVADSFPLFERRQLAQWNFEQPNDKCSITYYVFVCGSQDSLHFQKKAREYYMLSSCVEPFDNKAVYAPSYFKKGNFYLVRRPCSCQPAEDKSCNELARRLEKWVYYDEN
jgi:hypothetical protein